MCVRGDTRLDKVILGPTLKRLPHLSWQGSQAHRQPIWAERRAENKQGPPLLPPMGWLGSTRSRVCFREILNVPNRALQVHLGEERRMGETEKMEQKGGRGRGRNKSAEGGKAAAHPTDIPPPAVCSLYNSTDLVLLHTSLYPALQVLRFYYFFNFFTD